MGSDTCIADTERLIAVLSKPYEFTCEMGQIIMPLILKYNNITRIFLTIDRKEYECIECGEFYDLIPGFNKMELNLLNSYMTMAATIRRAAGHQAGHQAGQACQTRNEFIELFTRKFSGEYKQLCRAIMLYLGLCNYLDERADHGIDNYLYHYISRHIKYVERDWPIKLNKPYADCADKQIVYDSVYFAINLTHITEYIYDNYVTNFKWYQQ
jgi:hypothetical protein